MNVRFPWLLLVALPAAACREPNPAFTGLAEGPPAPLRQDGGGATRDATAGRTPVAVSCPADRDLLLCLRFERDLRDESPSGVTLMATDVSYSAGPDGYALALTPRSRVQAQTNLSVTQLTVEAWVRPQVLPTAPDRAVIVDNEAQWALFALSDGAIHCTVGGDSRTLSVPGVLTPGAWASLACVASATTLSLYVNGELKSWRPIEGLGMPSATLGLAIGGNIQSADRPGPDPFHGLVDNVRVWRRARTAQEICEAALGCRR